MFNEKQKSGDDVSSYFPFTTYFAFVPAFIALVVVVNGAFDDSTPEEHQQVVTRKWVNHGRSTSYSIEFSSWRQDRSVEQMNVPLSTYSQLKVNDPVIAVVYRGALGIHWIGPLRKPSRIEADQGGKPEAPEPIHP
jgi:hypothetical protein